MIDRIENGKVIQSWPSFQTECYVPEIDEHITEERWPEFGIYRRAIYPVTLAENEYIGGHDEPVVIEGRSYRVPIVKTKTAKEIAAELESWRERAEIPMWQGRERLIELGLIDKVEAALSAIPDEIDHKKALNKWEYATTIRRNDPLVLAFGPGLGLTDEQLDALFR